ncbi:hypothetical protein JCM9279_003852 [Rhodotorula babjevae]
MWQHAGNIYSQLPSMRSLWQQPAAPAASAPAARDRDVDSSPDSFDTADEGPPSLRVQSPQGQVYAPSVPSTTTTSRARGGPARAVGEVGQDSGEPTLVDDAAPVEAPTRAQPRRAGAGGPSPQAARPVDARLPPHAEPTRARAPTLPSTCALGQPQLAGGLMERLKAQRAARVDPAMAARPSAPPLSPPTDLLAGDAATRLQQPTAAPPLPPPTARSLPTRAAALHPSPPLQPFRSPPRSDERSPYPPDSASAYPTSFGLPADYYPLHDDGGDYADDKAHSPRPWHDGFSYVGPAGAALRTPSRSSDRTVLHEAHGRTSALEVDEQEHGAPRQAGPPSRAELLEWERARREADWGETRAPGESPAARERLGVEEDVRSSWAWEEATEGLRDPGRSTLADLEEERSEVRVDEILMQDWLLQPPPDRPVTDGLFSFPDMWHGAYAVLTPSHFYLLADADANAEAVLAFAVADVVAVERMSKHARAGFEPFFVKLRGGDNVYFAGTEKLDAELWSLKIKNAQSGAYRRSSSIIDDLDAALPSGTPSSSTRPRRSASSPPTSVSSLARPRIPATRRSPSPRRDQKDPRWMRSFNANMHARPVLVEDLPPHAAADDWSRSDPPSRSAWPARPPTEVYEPPSPPSPPSTVRLEAQHALELGVMRDRLELVRAVLTGQQEGLEGDAARAREAAQELEGLKEGVVQRAERERRALSYAEERLLEKIEWLEHLNGRRLRTSTEQDELARVVEEEARLADELRRELEELKALGAGAEHDGQHAAVGRGEELAGDGGRWRINDEPHQRSVRNFMDERAPSAPLQPHELPSKFSSNSSAPRRHRSSPPELRPTLSPVAQSTLDYRPQQHQQYLSEQGSVSRAADDDVERRYAQRRRLQELFLEVEERMLGQKRHLAASEDKNRQLTRTLGKAVKLVENSSNTHSSQLSALLERLDTLTAQLQLPPHLAVPPPALAPSSSSSSSSASRSTPTPPPPYHPTSPLPRARARRRQDGAEALPRRAAQALVGGMGGGGAVRAGGQPRLRVGGPAYGVDAALPQPAHDPRWAAGAGAARRARELDTQQLQLDGPVPSARPGAAAGTQGGDAAEREEAKPRVDGALQELRRGVGREGNPARAALAVWELLEQARRARTEHEQGKQAGKRAAREKKRGGGGFRLGGARGRAL